MLIRFLKILFFFLSFGSDDGGDMGEAAVYAAPYFIATGEGV